jgi:diacylglycerol kinase
MINMIVNIVMRKLINTGVNKGIDLASRKGKGQADSTPADHAQASAGKDTAKRAKQMAKMARRIGRF